ncbi:MAG: hypothetical protein COA58_10685 [Bacteroidetes bacterium]|nr:MAG: hypothetical protein COA58_10685 [Bacteroidota bacterium]
MYYSSQEGLTRQLEKLNHGVAIILACEKNFSFQDIQPHLQASKIPVVGAFFPGVIANEELHYTGFILLHFSTDFEILIHDSTKIETIKFENSEIKQGTGFIIMDGLADGNQEFLNKLFYQYGNAFRFIGSGAGSLDLVQKPCIFDDQGIYENKAIIVLLKTKVSIGLKHGYSRIAGPLIATETNASKIVELNWENAYETYASIVNKHSDLPISKDDFFNVSKGFPFGVSRKGHEDIVRDPISVDSNGTMNCIDDVPENGALYVLKGEPSKLIQAAKDSCAEAISQTTYEPSHCILIDCVTRVLYLEDRFKDEINTATTEIHSAFKNLPVEGILSMGEISTFKDGRLELYNKTFLTALIHE